jgi:hypothetical protein
MSKRLQISRPCRNMERIPEKMNEIPEKKMNEIGRAQYRGYD